MTVLRRKEILSHYFLWHTERFICTPHKSGCINDIAFREMDPDCTVFEDFRPVDTKFVRSYYGACLPTDEGKALGYESYGAWQFNECPKGGTYQFATADRFYAKQMPTVQCDQVKTGACVNDSSQFFCAVSQEVCEIEAGWTYLKSYELEQMSINPATCKLCDTVPPPPKTKYVEAGACIVPSTNKFVRCALIPEHCDGVGEVFYDPKALSTSSGLPSDAAICREQQGLHQVRVGRCDADADQYVCTTDKTACRNTLSFKPNDDTCSLLENLAVATNKYNFAATHFGHCSNIEYASILSYEEGRESYCTWSFTECKPATSDSNARPLDFGGAVPGVSGTYPTCHCDDVRTGGCVSNTDPSDMYCAVAASACGQGYTYFNVRTLELARGQDFWGENTICYLCKELKDIPTLPPKPTQPPPFPPTDQPVPAPTAPQNPSSVKVDPSPVSQPAPSPTGGNLRPSQETQSQSRRSPKENGAIAGIAVGAVVLMLLVVFAIHYFSSSPPNSGKEGAPQNEGAKGVPEETVPDKSMKEGQTQEGFVPQEDRSVT